MLDEWVKRDGAADGVNAEWVREYRAAGVTGIVREYEDAPAGRRFVAVVEDVRARRRLGYEPDLAAARRLVDEYAAERAAARRRMIRERNAERRRAAVSVMTSEGKEGAR